jgi:periplasmic protein TonB
VLMRLVSFFVLSIAVHAAALAYPVSFGGRSPMELLHVTILPMEPEGMGGMDNGGSGNTARQLDLKPILRRASAVSTKTEPKPKTDSSPQAIATDPPSTIFEGGIPLAMPNENSQASPAPILSSIASNGAASSVSASGGNGRGGEGSGSSGAGSGAGNGEGTTETGIVLTQARYRETPKPNYPDSARREGREGRVLLRVLVDDQGRSKQVEINSSSGSEVLDRAAAAAIKRWRFHPARYGDQPVESWLRVPIEFRLADAKPW